MVKTFKRLIQTRYNKEIFYNEGGETLAHITQRDGGCSTPRNIQGQVEWGSEQSDLAEGVPVHCRGG